MVGSPTGGVTVQDEAGSDVARLSFDELREAVAPSLTRATGAKT